MPSSTGYYISIDGQDVTSNFDPVLISIEIELGEGGKSDKCEITLDDTGGQLMFPRVGADLVAMLFNEDDGNALVFVGKTDEPKSSGSRGEGLKMSITAHSADMQGDGKTKKHKHKDGGTFKDAASEFGQAAGYTVLADDDVGSVERDYWAMSNESFFGWGDRMAHEIGATFKIQGNTAVFVSRNGSSSAGGTALPGFIATWGDNLISWDITPVVARAEFDSAKVRWYDPKAAQWNEEETPISSTNSD